MSDSPLRAVSKSPLAPETSGSSGAAAALTSPAPAAAQTEAAALIEDQQQLEQLRQLLLLPEQQRLAALQRRFDDPHERARDFGGILPQVINAQNEKSAHALGQALAPNIIPALAHVSGRQGEELENALRPVMLPSIRKAIQDALNEFVQSVDQTMKYSFNVQWRLEALRTGQSFAQVVMYHTMLYRVEQALLIHKKTGLLLWQEHLPDAAYKDADLGSGFLTAINDFARDWLSADEAQPINKLDLKGREVWVESGTTTNDLAYIAAVIKGDAPESLRAQVLQPALNNILNQRRNALLSFNGDTILFEACRPDLRSCLQVVEKGASAANQQAKGFKLPPTVAVPLALALIALLVWGFLNWRDHRRWRGYLAQLQNEPGLIVTEEERRFGWLGSRFTLSGLRDPLANDPAKMLETTALAPARVNSRWQGYYALDPAIVTRRAAQLLDAPEGVKFEARDGALYASGSATRSWILSAQPLGRMLPGVTRFDTSQLQDADQLRLLEMQRELEKNRLQFSLGTARLIAGQEAELQKMANRLQEAVALANYTRRPLNIEVIGQTDMTGSEAINRPLRLARAQSILTQLATRGIPRANLTASAGLPHNETNASDEELQRNRAVTFKITLADPQQSRP